MVSGPVIEYLGKDPQLGLTILAQQLDPDAAGVLERGMPNVRFEKWDANDIEGLGKHVKNADLVISLLPAWFHATVARVCIDARKDMVTASYVSPQMRDLNAEAKAAGVLLLNECGVDPGIDHMSAKKVIDEAVSAGKRVRSFRSYTGGLPAPDANDNPWGYKLSWSPRSVVTAATNSARYLQDGRVVNIPAQKLFQDVHQLQFNGIGTLDAYPNRDSIPYIQLYGLEGIDTMYRGTLRYPGWCTLWDGIVRLGMLRDEKPEAPTYARYMLDLVQGQGDPKQAVAEYLGIAVDDPVIQKLEYIGLFDDHPILNTPKDRIQLLADLMQQKLQFKPGERDLLVMRHIFEIEDNGHAYQVQSTMIEYGQPDGFSAMARTVGLPVAITAEMVLKGRIKLTGVHIPTLPEVYNHVLPALRSEGIGFEENIIDLR